MSLPAISVEFDPFFADLIEWQICAGQGKAAMVWAVEKLSGGRCGVRPQQVE